MMMKKRLFSAVLVLFFSVACSVMAVAATSGGDEADEVVRAGGFLLFISTATERHSRCGSATVPTAT